MLRRSAGVVVLLLVLFGGTDLYLHQGKVPPEAIQSSVTRTEALLDRAWQLPVAATFKRNVVWQSNKSSVGRRVWPMFFGPSAVTFDFESMQIFLQ